VFVSTEDESVGRTVLNRLRTGKLFENYLDFAIYLPGEAPSLGAIETSVFKIVSSKEFVWPRQVPVRYHQSHGGYPLGDR
jgi:hypothetical protein